MGFIKEPEGVDFIIESRPLTTEEEAKIVAYIQTYKAKAAKKAVRKKAMQVKKRTTKRAA